MPPRHTVDVPEAAALLGQGERALYYAVERGDVPSVQIGRRRTIPRAWLCRQLQVTRLPNDPPDAPDVAPEGDTE